MMYYKTPDGWESINNNYSKFYETKKGYYKFNRVEVTQPSLSGFGWKIDRGTPFKADKILLSDKEFKELIMITIKAHQVVIMQLEKALTTLDNKGDVDG